MWARAGAAIVTALAFLFISALALFAWGFLVSGEFIGIALGIGLVLLIPIFVWTIVREIRFGRATERLGSIEAREDFLSGVDLNDFSSAKSMAENDPESWRAWYRLSFSYDLQGDRRTARRAMRQAIALETACSDEGPRR